MGSIFEFKYKIYYLLKLFNGSIPSSTRRRHKLRSNVIKNVTIYHNPSSAIRKGYITDPYA